MREYIMNNIIKTTVFAFLIALSSLASAYEYKHIPNKATGDRIISFMVNAMEFNVDMNRIHLEAAKRDLGRCIADNILLDVKNAGFDDDTTAAVFSNMFGWAYKYYAFGSSRIDYMELDDINFVRGIVYRCIDEHPDKLEAVTEYAYSVALPEIKEKCFTPDGPNYTCVMETTSRYVKKLKEENNIK
jgi:hypothetical protein